ncbi:hypothetical protein CRUP_034447, partial [Coryphaenoides rupestris]
MTNWDVEEDEICLDSPPQDKPQADLEDEGPCVQPSRPIELPGGMDSSDRAGQKRRPETKEVATSGLADSGHKAAQKKKWKTNEIQAVEKHMMKFIETLRVPRKLDCLRCLL